MTLSPASPPPALVTPPFATANTLLRFAPRIRHGFFGRVGGVSTGIYSSLNTGPGSRDNAADVVENRRRIAAALGVAPAHLLSLHQVHSARAVAVTEPFVVIAEEGRPAARPGADGMVTRVPGLAMTALAADCAPILLADAEAGVVAALHAGWRGALGGIIAATIAQMIAAGATSTRIAAAIGPCIGVDSYEVGPEFLESFTAADPGFVGFFDLDHPRPHFDLKGFCAAMLARSGVGDIETLPADTCALEDDYFSNRRAFKRGEPDYGRNLSAIVLTA